MMFAHIGADADALVPLAVAVAAALVLLRSRRSQEALLVGAAAGALAFQVVHALEHALQIGYWLAHPTSPAWLTPWAAVGRDALAGASDGSTATGTELLHLIGNLVFLGGLCALWALAQRSWPLSRPALRRGTWLQSAHVAEHLLLTATTMLFGQALGVTTLFGLFPPASAAGVAFRVWAHFLINAGATWYAVAAVWPAVVQADGAEAIDTGS